MRFKMRCFQRRLQYTQTLVQNFVKQAETTCRHCELDFVGVHGGVSQASLRCRKVADFQPYAADFCNSNSKIQVRLREKGRGGDLEG